MHGGSNRSASDGAAIRPNITLAASQWLTPNVPNGGRSVSAELVASKGTTEDGEKRTVGLESQTSKGDLMLPSAAAQWPTPRTISGGGESAERKQELGRTISGGGDLQAAVEMWPTPAARDVKGANSAEHALVTGGGQEAHGPASELRGALPLFAPGPTDPLWRDILAGRVGGGWLATVADDEAGACPWAPATQPGVRMLVDGLALVVDESRNHQLRQVGNGVVPLQAAVAFVVLARRAGIFNVSQPVRLAA
jgi:hypothetical protein